MNYNGIKFLKEYLKAISLACRRSFIQLIVTDDQSTDDSIAYLKQEGCAYTINKSDKHGYAANANNGIRYAKSIGGFEHYIISNNDISLDERIFPCLSMALEFIGNINPNYGLIGFDEVLNDRIIYFNSYNYSNYDVSTCKAVKDIPGFFFLIRNIVIDKVGYLDEEYFMYGEDNDYYTRTLKAQFEIFNTNLPVMHFSEGSSVNEKLTSWYVYRNAFLFAQKNLGLIGFIKILFIFLNMIYNPWYVEKNPGNFRVTRNGFIYNNYLLIKSLIWNLNYFLAKK